MTAHEIDPPELRSTRGIPKHPAVAVIRAIEVLGVTRDYQTPMCGRYKLETDWSEIAIVYRAIADLLTGVVPRYNVAPTDRMPILEGPERTARLASWGFTKWQDTNPKPGFRPINAKSETVATNGMFSRAFRAGRCLVPADGFYEWRTLADGKQPFLFERPDHRPFAFAGLWSRWAPVGGEPLDVFCILTTTPNAVTREVHDRMPVILPDAASCDLWTDPGADPEALEGLLGPVADDVLVARPVSRRLNSVKNDDPEVLVVESTLFGG